MSTLVVVQSLFGGGAEKQIRLLITENVLPNPIILFLGDPDSRSLSFVHKLKLAYFQTKSKSIIRSLFCVRKIISSCNPKCIFSGVLNVNFGLSILNILDFNDRKYIIRESGMISQYSYGFMDFAVKLIYRYCYPKLYAVIVQSLTHKFDCELFFDTSNTVIVPNLVTHKKSVSMVSQNLHFSEDAWANFVWIGRLEKEKDPIFAIKLMAELHRNAVNCSLTIIGSGSLENYLEEMISTHGLENYVSLVGHVEDPFLQLSSEEVLLLTSQHDTYPNVVIEAEAVPMKTVAVEHIGSILEMSNLSSNILLVPRNVELAVEKILTELVKVEIIHTSELFNLHRKFDAQSLREYFN